MKARPEIPVAASIHLEQLSKQHASMSTPAVDEVSLEVVAGEFLTLLGPSGSGKSTLLGLIAGFSRPSSGRVIIEGQDVTRIPPHRRNIGMVFQNYALFPHLSALDNVAFGLRRRGVGRNDAHVRAMEALEKVDLAALASRRPNELSGGQQQRVAVARAIVFGPQLVLMDEPFGALDRRLREGMQLEMLRLHKEIGMTFIFVTHDQEEALSMSDRIAVMQDGKIEQIGKPNELYERPASVFVARFLGESNLFAGRSLASGQIETDVGVLRTSSSSFVGECTLMVRPEDARLIARPSESKHDVNRVPCLVEEIVYLGSSRRVMVRFHTGETGIVNSPARENDLRVGDSASLEWAIPTGHLIQDAFRVPDVPSAKVV